MSLPPWLGDGRAAWLDEVTDWVARVVPAADRGPVLALESVKEKAWGAVLRVVTPDAALYFKAPGPATRHESTIISDLTARWPALGPDLVAVDHERSWMVFADHGVPMRDVLTIPEQLATLERLLPAYAEMQASTIDRVPAWLAVGTPDRRVDRLPDLLDQLLHGATPIGAVQIDDADRSAYLATLPLLTKVCADLATTTTPDALDHADMHGTNVLVDGPRARLVDWGDSCITHPFSSLFVVYELVIPSLPLAEQRPATLHLRDVYLDAWSSTTADRAAFGWAVWVAHVTRAVAIAYETLGESDDHSEIVSLLHAWHAKRSQLGRPDEVVLPI